MFSKTRRSNNHSAVTVPKFLPSINLKFKWGNDFIHHPVLNDFEAVGIFEVAQNYLFF
jgi:hypothetical protein